MAVSPAAAGPTVASIFNRLDVRPKDANIVRDEMKKMVEDAKVGGGVFGGTKVNMATDALMDQFDADKSGKIDQVELGKQMYGFLLQLAGAGGADQPPPKPGELTTKVMEWFDSTDTDRSGKVSQGELKIAIQRELEKAGQSMPGTKAEIAAKIGIHLLDEGRDGQAGRDEVETLAKDVEALQPAPAPAPVPDPAEPTDPAEPAFPGCA